MKCLLTLLFMFLDLDTVKPQRLNKQDFTIKKLTECNDQWTQIEEIAKR